MVFEAELHCDSCVYEVSKILKEIPGVESVDCIVFLNNVAIMLAAENPPEVSLLESELNKWAQGKNRAAVILK